MVIFKKKCYVIMPFSDTEKHTKEYWTNHYEFFLKPFIQKRLKMNAERSKALSGDIVNNIITGLTNAPIVIADITEYNPNVLWELGIRHCFAKNGTILIAEKGLKLPFDLFRESTLFYGDHSLENPDTKEFFKDLKEAVDISVNNPTRLDSPVFVAISERGTMHEIITKDETIRKLNAILMEFEDNLNYLNFIFQQVKQNRKYRQLKNPDTGMTQVCMTSNAIDLLISNQYLNQPREFYEECRSVLLWLMGINESIMAWPYLEEGVENWLYKYLPTVKKELKSLQRQIKMIKNEFEKIK